MSENNELSLSKFLAVSGIASRRHSVDLIRAGAVTVNGTEVRNPAVRVSEADTILCHGKEVRSPERRYYIMLHKPRGYVCTSEDPHAAKKALDLIHLPENPRLYSAGRLDKDSEGLILFSNDGDFVHTLTHPGNGVQKMYEVSMERPLMQPEGERMLHGIVSDGETLRALTLERIGIRKYRMVLGEGKNREIRRMAEAVHNRAVRLKRVAVGRLFLGGLPCGEWRFLTEEDCRKALWHPVEEQQKDLNNGKDPE